MWSAGGWLHEPAANFRCYAVSARAEFLFLYISRYLEEKLGVKVERGDARILTKPLMDKIREQILRADLIIGDVTGGNPNVFYELGLAHAHGKPIIFLTQDSPDTAPVDIRQFEFIQYDLSRDQELLTKLHSAVQNAFGPRYEALFEKAFEFLKRFNTETKANCTPAPLEEFQARVMKGEQMGSISLSDQEDLLIRFLLPKIIDDFTDSNVISLYTKWISETFE